MKSLYFRELRIWLAESLMDLALRAIPQGPEREALVIALGQYADTMDLLEEKAS